jgi:hypothetical protein
MYQARLKPADLLAFGDTAANVLAHFLRSNDQPVGAKTLLVNVTRLPEAIDDAFPGYLATGALGFLLRPAIEKR